ncbi:jg19078 [Pararge aegeria aegeria]|uniref:Jg19078 protein n=1 Tax=Pararge aegeria aegeria TaxID=348720 RepID=A0A8S4SIJ8_9NEOP|nr:jg19078 [Pararge aegeria aegeria]
MGGLGFDSRQEEFGSLSIISGLTWCEASAVASYYPADEGVQLRNRLETRVMGLITLTGSLELYLNLLGGEIAVKSYELVTCTGCKTNERSSSLLIWRR